LWPLNFEGKNTTRKAVRATPRSFCVAVRQPTSGERRKKKKTIHSDQRRRRQEELFRLAEEKSFQTGGDTPGSA
jgi:hypothetical protein